MTYVFHTDPGHGWLEVSLAEIIELGIENKISQFSYCKADTAYLEEDCDAGVFLNAKHKRGETVEIREQHRDPTPIRNFKSYSPHEAVALA